MGSIPARGTMDRIFFVTGSENKVREAQAVIPTISQLALDLPEIQSLSSEDIITHKLREARTHCPDALIVEDTSLFLAAMNGLPGPFVKWFEKTLGNEGIHEIAQRFDEYHAEAVTSIGYLGPDGTSRYFAGRVTGTIVPPDGPKGFGWDQIFKPAGHEETFGAMSREKKHRISMRRQALDQLSEFLGYQG